ncbi:MAG: DNA topoisomerase-3 [Paraglaciecola sp.]|jgi:DNA topoisomerase-3
MKVCIAEKPSVAREIAFILGAKSRKDGYFEGNGYCVTWTFGHLCTLKMPEDYKPEWKSWNISLLPMLPEKFEIKLVASKSIKKQFSTIKKLFKSAEVVINCGDAGQEGELIQRWVMKEAKYKGKVLRLWISSLTPEAIREGFRNLKNASDFDNLYYAGSSRAIGDWLLGMNATRLYTKKYGGYKQVLSVGRVQTPTLAMVVERHKEIINFVPHPFWELQTLYREVAFNCEKGRFLKKEEGEKWLQHVEGKPFTIVSSERKRGKEYAPRLFDLTGLQVHCNKRFGFTADATLKIVQKLYEQKVVTYPRVDTTYLPNDVYPKIPGILKNMQSFSQLVQPLLNKKLPKSKRVFDDKKVTDHHAIIPTGVEKTLPQNEQKVYDAIARRFIAAFYPDCIVAKTTVIGEVDGLKFKTNGKEILEEGWRLVFPHLNKKMVGNQAANDSNNSKKKEDEEKILPEFKKGESGPHQPSLTEKQTQPPKYFTEATLLRAMETAGKKVDDDELRELMKANGIGRPSTRANIIETLFRRRYTERQKKNILPTKMGVDLIDTIGNDLLKSAELTGQWEKQLRDIEEGKFFAKQFIGNMKTMVSQLVTEVNNAPFRQRFVSDTPTKYAAKARGQKLAQKKIFTKKTEQKIAKKRTVKSKNSSLTESTCPKCTQGQLLKGSSAYGCSRWQEGCKFRLPFAFSNKKISDNQLLRLVNQGSTVTLKGFKIDGKTQVGKVIFTADFQLKFEHQNQPKFAQKSIAKKTVKKEMATCPKCQKGQILKGTTAYGCSRWQEGCDFKFLFETLREKAVGKTLTKELVLEILQKGV